MRKCMANFVPISVDHAGKRGELTAYKASSQKSSQRVTYSPSSKQILLTSAAILERRTLAVEVSCALSLPDYSTRYSQ